MNDEKKNDEAAGERIIEAPIDAAVSAFSNVPKWVPYSIALFFIFQLSAVYLLCTPN